MNSHNCFKKVNIIYVGKIRAGAYPQKTKENYKVIECKRCGLVKLNKFPKLLYKGKQYRDLYNRGLGLNKFKKFSNVEQTPKFFGLKNNVFKNKIVLDYGCGFGVFLDNIKKIAKKTLAIEPQNDLQKFLKNKGHEVIHNKKIVNYKNKVDIITSFGVIEHTKNPKEYLNLAYKLLKERGSLYLCTDNLDDILIQSNLKEFKEFYFRTAHYWYFNKKNLINLLHGLGFKNIKLNYLHNHGYNNFLYWLEHKKPLHDNSYIKNKLNARWKKILKKSGRTELIFISCNK